MVRFANIYTLLNKYGSLKSSLAKAINYASYIQNRVPHKHLDGMNPFKTWSGHKPYVTHFSIFGSKAWARIPTEKRKALQPQIQECLFVGIMKIQKGKRLKT